MTIFLLAGNSISNKDWIEAVAAKLSPELQTEILYYDHWQSGEELINLDLELEKLVAMTNGVEEYAIFAKSAGALLALKGVEEGKLKPIKCIFAGTAVGWGKARGLPVDQWLGGEKNSTPPTLFIQKEDDPAIGTADLEQLLTQLGRENYKLKIIPGSDHSYDDLDLLKKEIEDYLTS